MANVVVRDPFHEVCLMMRRAFEDSFPRAAAVRGPISLDVYERDGKLIVEAPLPGFKADDVHVTLEQGALTIRAEHEEAQESQGQENGDAGAYFVRERHRGAVSRSILIGDTWNADGVQASLKDGLLTLEVEKQPEALPKEIAVTAV